jgi:hypothetical protein
LFFLYKIHAQKVFCFVLFVQAHVTHVDGGNDPVFSEDLGDFIQLMAVLFEELFIHGVDVLGDANGDVLVQETEGVFFFEDSFESDEDLMLCEFFGQFGEAHDLSEVGTVFGNGLLDKNAAVGVGFGRLAERVGAFEHMDKLGSHVWCRYPLVFLFICSDL